MGEIWIVGATGRSGRMIAANLAGRHDLVLAGRDATRLHELAGRVGGTARTVAGATPEALAGEIGRARPAVVINLIGPFTRTAAPIVRACPPGTGYVDLSNELFGIKGLLDRHDEAVAAGRTVVTGAGFGVLGTEALALHLCAGRPVPERVRFDRVAMIAGEAEPMGEALAGSIVDGILGGGWAYRGGRLVPAPVGAAAERQTMPDGSTATTSSFPSGDLIAVQRATGAADVLIAAAEAPSGPLVRVAVPVARSVLRVPAIRRFATARMAAMTIGGGTPAGEYTWVRGRVEERGGPVREGWLRAGEAMAFTCTVTALTAARLARGEGKPGAYTPGALFGTELAEEAGATFH